MNLELIITLVVAFGVPTGALIFFSRLARKEEREAKQHFGRL